MTGAAARSFDKRWGSAHEEKTWRTPAAANEYHPFRRGALADFSRCPRAQPAVAQRRFTAVSPTAGISSTDFTTMKSAGWSSGFLYVIRAGLTGPMSNSRKSVLLQLQLQMMWGKVTMSMVGFCKVFIKFGSYVFHYSDDNLDWNVRSFSSWV